MKKRIYYLLTIIMILSLILSGCETFTDENIREYMDNYESPNNLVSFSDENIREYMDNYESNRIDPQVLYQSYLAQASTAIDKMDLYSINFDDAIISDDKSEYKFRYFTNDDLKSDENSLTVIVDNKGRIETVHSELSKFIVELIGDNENVYLYYSTLLLALDGKLLKNEAKDENSKIFDIMSDLSSQKGDKKQITYDNKYEMILRVNDAGVDFYINVLQK